MEIQSYPLPSRKIGLKNQVEILFVVAKIYEETSAGASLRMIREKILVEFKQPIKPMLEDFFIPLKMIYKENNLFYPTDDGLRFYQRCLLNPGDEKTIHLKSFKSVLSDSWFGIIARRILQQVNEINLNIVMEKLAQACGEDPYQYRLNYKVRYLIDYLAYGCVVARKGDQLTLPKDVRVRERQPINLLPTNNFVYHDLLPLIFSKNPESISVEYTINAPMKMPVGSLKSFLDSLVDNRNYRTHFKENKLVIEINLETDQSTESKLTEKEKLIKKHINIKEGYQMPVVT